MPISFLSRGVAALLLVSGIVGWAYTRGRVDGWERREIAQNAADLRALGSAQDQFLADLRIALDEGENTARLESDFQQTLGGIRNELARLSSGTDCPSPTDRSLLIDRAISEANATLRASGAELDGAPALGASDRRPGE